LSTVAISLGLLSAPLALAEITVQMHEVNEKGAATPIGTVAISESEYGLVFSPELKGLTAGLHGFHVHEKLSCEPSKQDGTTTPAGAAGGHYDPEKSGKHGSPWGAGHLGDLP